MYCQVLHVGKTAGLVKPKKKMNTDLRGQTAHLCVDKIKGVWWMPWHQMAMKDVAWLR